MRSKPATIKNLLIVSSFTEKIRAAANRISFAARQAYAVRDLVEAGKLGGILVDTNLPAYASIGHYFTGLELCNEGRGNLERAKEEFDLVHCAPYHLRAALAKARVRHFQCGFNSSEYENLMNCSDIVTAIEARRAIAIGYASDGEHKRALALLESVIGLVLKLQPSRFYYEYLNSLSVELCAVGLLEDALKLSQVVTASPLASRFHEWTQTHRDAQKASEAASLRHSRAFISRPSNLIQFPIPDAKELAARKRHYSILVEVAKAPTLTAENLKDCVSYVQAKAL